VALVLCDRSHARLTHRRLQAIEEVGLLTQIHIEANDGPLTKQCCNTPAPCVPIVLHLSEITVCFVVALLSSPADVRLAMTGTFVARDRRFELA